MKPSRTAPPRATNPRVPSPDRAPSTSHPAEGPAPPVAAAPAPTRAAAPPEPPGSPPSSLFSTPHGIHLWHTAARDALLDLVTCAREGSRRPHRRVLSRAEIRRQSRAAFHQLNALLTLALTPLEATSASPHRGSTD